MSLATQLFKYVTRLHWVAGREGRRAKKISFVFLQQRKTKRGERALTLCMPVTRKVRNEESQDSESEDQVRTFTSFVYNPRWFVLSQTTGDELVPTHMPEWNALHALAALDIEQTTFTHTEGNCPGYARWRQIAINPVAQLPHKTLFHEVAHLCCLRSYVVL